MNSYRLIAFDMDGTLLNSEKKISELTQSMIHQAAASGKEVILSTGRSIPELQDYLGLLPDIRYLICASGALVYDCREKKSIFAKRIPVPVVKEILQEGKAEDAMPYMLRTETIVQADQAAHMSRYQMEQYQELIDRITKKTEDIYAYYAANEVAMDKVNLYHRTAKSRDRSYERLKDLELELAYAEETSLECSAKGVTKALGLQKVCEFLDIPMEQTIAVGDADNDIDILKAAGLSIAMGNANETVKSICDVVVGDCDHDGCAEAIRRYLL